MSVTIRDVARAAGVSTATAARALGGYGHASPAARRKVSESARRLGYRPNVVARALVSRATTTVGLVVGDIENPFFAAAARGLADVMDAHGYTVLLANADEDAGRERRAVDALRARQVDGMVVVPAPGASPEHLAELVAAGDMCTDAALETRDDLTAQERQVALFGRDGMSNIEIDARLFLSHARAWQLGEVLPNWG